MKRLPERIRRHCTLAELSREYTLNEIAIITRAAPARMLGLRNKGHLGPGADADVTVYSCQNDLEEMFRMPRYVFSHGSLIIDDGEIRAVTEGNTLMVRPDFDIDTVPVIQEWFDRNSTLQFANFPVDAHDVGDKVSVVPHVSPDVLSQE